MSPLKELKDEFVNDSLLLLFDGCHSVFVHSDMSHIQWVPKNDEAVDAHEGVWTACYLAGLWAPIVVTDVYKFIKLETLLVLHQILRGTLRML